jgi:hypothetical protein
VGDTTTSPGRLSSLQEIFTDEVTDEVTDEERSAAKTGTTTERDENSIWQSIWHSGTVIEDQLFIWDTFGTLWHSLDSFEWRENSQLV